MAFAAKSRQVWRPAPFPVYAPDRRRILLEHALVLCCLLVFAAALLPRRAGNEGVLLLPVDYQCIELEQRSPAIITVNLPAGDYEVEPESLGYFARPGEFVYTAAVARGVIYGRVDGQAVLLEIAAPQDSREFLQYHLDQIRAEVVELNRLENLLANARREAKEMPGRLDREVAAQYTKLGTKAGTATESQALELAQRASAAEDEAMAALKRLAQQRAGLKQRYYACQRARLEVQGQQTALQLALARLPEPNFSELLSLGDAEVVSSTVQAEQSRLENAWRGRLRDLHQELDVMPSVPLPLPAEPALPGLPPPLSVDEPVESAALRLARVLRETRRTELESEIAELENCLAHLAQVRRRMLTGQAPSWTSLPRLESKPQRLARQSLAALPGFGVVLGLDGGPEPTLKLLEQLARRFEGLSAEPVDSLPELADQGYPFELPYGLLAVDLAVRKQRAAAGVDGQAHARELEEGIQTRLAFPDDYGLASLHLAYLRCLEWYARQERTVLDDGDEKLGLETGPANDLSG